MLKAEELQKTVDSRQEVTAGMKTIAVTSGKGGVGKTIVVANLAIAISRKGQDVIILDADFGLANIDIVLGVTAPYNIAHAISGFKSFEEIIVEGPESVRIIPASSGLQEITGLSERQEQILIDGLQKACCESDIVLIDTAAGISRNVIRVLSLSDEIIIVTDSQPTSLIDAYAVVKVVTEKDPLKKIKVLINSSASRKEAMSIFGKLEGAVRTFLNKNIELIGFIAYDNYLLKSVRMQEPVLIKYPEAPSSKCFDKVAQVLVDMSSGKREEFSRSKWRDLLEGIRGRFLC